MHGRGLLQRTSNSQSSPQAPTLLKMSLETSSARPLNRDFFGSLTNRKQRLSDHRRYKLRRGCPAGVTGTLNTLDNAGNQNHSINHKPFQAKQVRRR
jgi:hypothetical protein